MICDRLPRVPLAYLPTPLEEAPRLSAAVGGPRIFIKRDDRSGLSFGGNKPRIFEFVLGDAVDQGCDLLITSAGVQSNQLREVTSAANKLGLKSVIVICGATGEGEPKGNLLLFHLLGAEIRHFPHRDFHHPQLLPLLASIKAEQSAKGHRPYVVHFAGKPGALGSVSHVNASEELATQFAQQGIVPDYLVVPSGSGVTASGFVLGFKHFGLPTRVMSISVIRRAAEMIPDIVSYANQAADLLGLSSRVGPEDFTVFDHYIPPGYGVLTPQIIEAIRLVARSEGYFLDPTYNGKAMAALIDQARRGAFTREKVVVLLHTGGVPALFAENGKLLAE
jgi:1-aminocyclopropane-1-carboxylate deaminase/D-cysteine desulfhydrase-like pyridoxal-dependent ACC family enzyme